MAIGTLAAVGLGVAGVSSFLGAKSSSKAATKSANIAADTATQNNALTRDIYNENKQVLSPYVQTGLPATQAINSFLGLTPAQGQQTQAQPNALAQFAPQGNIYEGMDGPLGGRGFEPGAFDAFGSPVATFGASGINSLGGFGGGFGGGTPQAGPQPVNGRDAFKTFLDNSDYAFQFGEGANKVNSGYAGNGTLQSGAAMKALEDYRQNLQQGYRGEFLNALANQQGVGASAAGAQAGVATQFGNTISANNNSAGTAAANAALLKGQNNPFANALGVLGGGLFGMGR